MQVESVTMYRTTDGQMFESIEEACKHEAKHEFRQFINDQVHLSVPTDPDALADAILSGYVVRPKNEDE